jgi:hypothetical protein
MGMRIIPITGAPCPAKPATTMPKSKVDADREKDIANAIRAYSPGVNRQFALLLRYTVFHTLTTLQNRIKGAQPYQKAHEFEQRLSVEEKAVVQFCLVLDDLCHRLRVSTVKAFASALLPRKPGFPDPQPGENWMP